MSRLQNMNYFLFNNSKHYEKSECNFFLVQSYTLIPWKKATWNAIKYKEDYCDLSKTSYYCVHASDKGTNILVFLVWLCKRSSFRNLIIMEFRI